MVEKAEDKSTRRAKATTAREFRLALPHELDDKGRLACVRAFAHYMVDTYGVVVDFSIHLADRDGDERNFHTHILVSDRRITDAGFGGKVREFNLAAGGKKHIAAIRQKWADIANEHLAAAGIDAKIDHRSYKAQWIDRDAAEHMGPAATAMERRGEGSDIGDRNREIKAGNNARAAKKAEYEQLGKAMLAEEKARIDRADQRAEQAAIRSHDPAAILAAITAKRSTFTKAEVEADIRKSVHSPRERAELVAEIFARPELVGLAEQPGEKATRYTTEAVLKHEAQGLAAARDLMADKSHGLSRNTIRRVVEDGKYGSMSAEQHSAFVRATGREGLAIIAGEAGTGKSYAANAIRTAYEAEGNRVIGLAVTNKVIQDMARDGFTHTRTIHGALQDVARERAGWNSRTVLIIDEAAMLSTKQTVDIMAAAARAGAKVIAIQDTAQLGSAFARGGLAGAIEAEHSAAVTRLSEIRRIKDTATDAAGQRKAFNLMHEGRWKEALSIMDNGEAIHWNATNDEARAALAAQYGRDVEARPDRRRFTLAQSNAEVLRLNAELRTIHRARGDLGADHVLQTKDGPQAFANGDRIQFTASAYHKADREAGLANGNHGTIREIDGLRVTVELDAAKGQQGRVIAFTVGENARAGEFNGLRHGYAGTIYRSQGSTVDEVYRLHTGGERAATNYVGNTRHTEALHLYTSREAVRGADPWMREAGGLVGLTEAKRASAERSYAAWTSANPDFGRRYGLADYVAYVQDQWAGEQGRAVDIEALARQMGRREEARAASQFFRVERETAPDHQPEATLRPAAEVATTPRASLRARLVAFFGRAKVAAQQTKAGRPLTMDEMIAAREAELAAQRQKARQQQGQDQDQGLEL